MAAQSEAQAHGEQTVGQRPQGGIVEHPTAMPKGSPQAAPPPVLLGTAAEGPQDRSQAYQAGQPTYRTDPVNASVEDVPLLKNLPAAEAARKLKEIHRGGALAQEIRPLPVTRPYRDVLWAVPFAVVLVAMVAAAAYFAGSVRVSFEAAFGALHASMPILGALAAAGAAGGAAALVAALILAAAAAAAPGAAVWTSLCFGPALLVLSGVAVLAQWSVAAGLSCIASGGLMLTCIFCCCRRYIPFTIKVVESVSGVFVSNPMMLGVSVLGSMLGLIWSFACSLAFVGAYLEYGDQQESGTQYAVYFVAVFILYWGAQATYNMCHVTYCGVYGRWYYSADVGVALRRSFAVAVTTSFGSICFGSFLVAGVRALEATISLARSNARRDRNVVQYVILTVLQCLVSCLGDILEYFSEWAYVQCAVRGVGFLDAARITYSQMTCANVYILIHDLLIDSVVSLGALLCGLVGAGAGAGAGYALGGIGLVVAGGSVGAWSGLLSGGSAAGIFSSGTKTVLALWAEDPAPLVRAQPETHRAFEDRILAKLGA